MPPSLALPAPTVTPPRALRAGVVCAVVCGGIVSDAVASDVIVSKAKKAVKKPDRRPGG